MCAKISLVLFFVAAINSFSQISAQDNADSNVLNAVLLPAKEVYYIGENIPIKIIVENTGHIKYNINKGLFQSLEIINTSGKRVQQHICWDHEPELLSPGKKRIIQSCLHSNYGKLVNSDCFVFIIPIGQYKIRLNARINRSVNLISDWINIEVVEPKDIEFEIYKDYIRNCTIKGKYSVEKVALMAERLKNQIEKNPNSFYRPYMMYQLTGALRFSRTSVEELYSLHRRIILEYPQFNLNRGLLGDLRDLSFTVYKNRDAFNAFLDTLEQRPINEELQKRIQKYRVDNIKLKVE